VTHYDDTTEMLEGWDLQANGTWLHTWWHRDAQGDTIAEGVDAAKPPTLTPVSALTSSDPVPGKPPSGWEFLPEADRIRWLSGQMNAADESDAARPALHSQPQTTIVSGTAVDEVFHASQGSDEFHFGAVIGHDTITGFEAGPGFVDVIQLKKALFADFKAVYTAARQAGSDVVITIDNDNAHTLKGVKLSALMMDDFRFVA
jgi:Ca2+-binding RTX toxin-like protein